MKCKSFSSCILLKLFLGVVPLLNTKFKGDVDRSTIEEYVELEKQIANHESQRWVRKIETQVLTIQDCFQPSFDTTTEEESISAS